MNSLIYFDLTKQGHVQQLSAGPLIINNDLSIIHKTFTEICSVLPWLRLLQRYTHKHTQTRFVPTLTYISTRRRDFISPYRFLSRKPTRKLNIVSPLTTAHPKNPHQCVQMEPCLLIEGAKWTASSWRTRLIRQRMPRGKWRQTETVKRRSRGTLKRRPCLARRPDAGCSLSYTQLSHRSVDGTIIPQSAVPWLSIKSCCSRSRARARSDWCPPSAQDRLY